MRQSQKTEQQADRLSRIGLENRKYTRARSTGYGEGKGDRKSTRLNSSHTAESRMPSSA